MAEIIRPLSPVKVTFSLEPVTNVIGSLSLLNMTEAFTGMGEWVYQTAKGLTKEQLLTNQVVLLDCGAYTAGVSWPSFPQWLDDLAALDPVEMRDRALHAHMAQIGDVAGADVPSAGELLADRATYLSLVKRILGARGHPFERRPWEEEHKLLADPVAMKETFVSHLRWMWDEVVAEEWQRNLPLLEASVAAFQGLDVEGLTAVEVLERVSLRMQIPQEARAWLSQIEHLILIPSAHTGPYLLHMESQSDVEVRMVYGARAPAGMSSRTPTLSRSELLMRLNALADDSRLRILELLGRQGEMGTPDIIARLGLSQSAASRHLEHLTATGYLFSRREGVTNLYQLNPDRIDQTFEALRAFCGR